MTSWWTLPASSSLARVEKGSVFQEKEEEKTLILCWGLFFLFISHPLILRSKAYFPSSVDRFLSSLLWSMILSSLILPPLLSSPLISFSLPSFSLICSFPLIFTYVLLSSLSFSPEIYAEKIRWCKNILHFCKSTIQPSESCILLLCLDMHRFESLDLEKAQRSSCSMLTLQVQNNSDPSAAALCSN